MINGITNTLSLRKIGMSSKRVTVVLISYMVSNAKLITNFYIKIPLIPLFIPKFLNEDIIG